MNKFVYLGLGFMLALGGMVYLTIKSQQNDIVIDEDVIVEDVIDKEDSEKKVMYGMTEAFSFRDAFKNADLIAEIEITEHVEDLNEPSPKSLFEGKLIKTYKNKKTLDKIRILQAGNQEYSYDEFSLFKPGEKYILFLKKAVGDGFVGTDTYWILGEETTIYSVLGPNSIYKWALKDPDLSTIELNDTSMKVKNDNYRGQLVDKKLFEEKIKSIVTAEE